jgi:tetratricopeptide (TPR) repeat protein
MSAAPAPNFPRRVASGLLVAAAAILSLATAPTVARAQDLDETLEILGNVTYTPPDAKDYFLRDTVKEVMTASLNVKKYHLSDETFWRHYRAGRKERAMSETIFVLRVFPNHPEALGLLSIICRELDEPETAIPFYERALRLYPNRAYTRAQYGAYLGSIGQKNAGRVYLEEALRMDPNLAVARGWLESLDNPTPVVPQQTPRAAAPAASGAAGHR